MGTGHRGRVSQGNTPSAEQARRLASALLLCVFLDCYEQEVTALRVWSLLQHLFEVARRDWGIDVQNPLKLARRPKPALARECPVPPIRGHRHPT
ncbi:MAG: hypothetical protein ACYDHM_01960 [Acidiferrobacterales bacterium]